MPALPDGRPGVLMGGLVPASFRRIAAHGEGWMAPFMGHETLVDGAESLRRAWSEAGRPGRPRLVVARYFSLGDGAGEIADHYLEHYYGEYFAAARADTVTDAAELRAELDRLSEVGVDDVLLFPCSGELGQVERLADAVDRAGFGLRAALAAAA
jgi:alkanesulfonate monooxygenase SsuD/methylene tetrahydromethanopterin reductase-like flavin-dependent oxidoreductase (luciferase family)